MLDAPPARIELTVPSTTPAPTAKVPRAQARPARRRPHHHRSMITRNGVRATNQSVASTPMLAIMSDLIRQCGLARRSRPVPTAVAPEPRPPSRFRALASTSHRWRWPGWQNYRPRGGAGGRPRLRGTPVLDETVRPGARSTGGGPVSSSQGDHRTVALRSTGRARTQAREASRASRRVTTGSVVVPSLGVKPPEPSYAAEPAPRRTILRRVPAMAILEAAFGWPVRRRPEPRPTLGSRPGSRRMT